MPDSFLSGDTSLLEITRFAKHGGPLTKRISLGPDGSVVSDGSHCRMAEGTAVRLPLDGLQALANTLTMLEPNEAIALGRLRDGLPTNNPVITVDRLNAGNATKPGSIARTSEYIIHKPGQRGLMLIDYDIKTMPHHVAERVALLGGFWPALVSIAPAFATAGRLQRRSTSTGLFRSDTGALLPGSDGQHVYFIVQDAAAIEQALNILHDRAWGHGLAWFAVTTNGSLVERSIVDRMVGQANRLVFETNATVVAPIMQDLRQRQPVVTEGGVLDIAAAIPPLTPDEQSRLQEQKSRDSWRIRPEETRTRAAYIDKQTDEIATRTGVTREGARRTAEQLATGTLLPDVELPFDRPDLRGCTVRDVLRDPDHFVGAKMSDPVEGVAYGRNKAMLLRGRNGTLWINSFARGGRRYELQPDRLPPFLSADYVVDETLPPTPRDRVSFDEGRAEMREAVTAFFDDGTEWLDEREASRKAWEREKRRCKKEGNEPPPRPPDSPGIVRLAKATVGGSKTTLALDGAVRVALPYRDHPEPRKTVFLAPTVELAAQIGERARKHPDVKRAGLRVAVLRGRDQPNPDNPDEAMCPEPGLVGEALAASQPIQQGVCFRQMVDDTVRACRSFEPCRYQHELALARGAHIVCMAHSHLTRAAMAELGEIGHIIIDESVVGAFVWGLDEDERAAITLDSIDAKITTTGTDCDPKIEATINERSALLGRVLRAQANDGLVRQLVANFEALPREMLVEMILDAKHTETARYREIMLLFEEEVGRPAKNLEDAIDWAKHERREGYVITPRPEVFATLHRRTAEEEKLLPGQMGFRDTDRSICDGKPLPPVSQREHAALVARLRYLDRSERISKEVAAQQIELEYAPKPKAELIPGMSEAERGPILEAYRLFNLGRRRVKVWHALRELVADDGPNVSGRARLITLQKPEGDVRALELCGRSEIGRGWNGPTLIIDATGEVEVNRAIWPEIELVADVAIEAPHQHNFVVNAAFAKSHLVFNPRHNSRRHTARATAKALRRVRAIVVRAAQTRFPQRVLMIGQAAVEAAMLKLGPLPPNLVTRHFNSVAGLDDFGPAPGRDGVALAIIVGNPRPSFHELNRLSGAFWGAAVELPEGCHDFYLEPTPREMRDGTWTRGIILRHPDPRTDLLLQQIVAAANKQAEGRVRGILHGPGNPVHVWFFGDVLPDQPVEAVFPDTTLEPSPRDLQLAEGMAFECPACASKAHHEIWTSTDTAKKAYAAWNARDPAWRGEPLDPISLRTRVWGENSYKGVSYREIPPKRTYETISFKPRGSGRVPDAATFFSPSIREPAGYLTDHLGPLAWCHVDEPEPPADIPEHEDSTMEGVGLPPAAAEVEPPLPAPVSPSSAGVSRPVAVRITVMSLLSVNAGPLPMLGVLPHADASMAL